MTLLFLTRRKRLSKDEWRTAGVRRTFDPINCGPLIGLVWPQMPSAPAGSILEAILHEEGRLIAPPVPKLRGPALWEVNWGPPVSLCLREEEALSQLGGPARSGRLLAARLTPWNPVRITLNGRQASTSGQYYNLLEQHVLLCDGEPPEAVGETRHVRLEADLL